MLVSGTQQSDSVVRVYVCVCMRVSVSQFSRSVVSDFLRPHGLQHARHPCPSPTPRVYSNSCPLSWWCHPTISSSVIPFSSRLQSFSVSGSFQMSQFFTSGGQSIGASASASVLPVNIWGWFPLGSTGLISLLSKRLSRVFSSPTVWRHQVFDAQPFLLSSFHIPTWLLEKPWLWLHGPLPKVSKRIFLNSFLKNKVFKDTPVLFWWVLTFLYL